MSSESLYFSINVFAKKLSAHPNTIRRCIKSGKITAINIGNGKKKVYRIPASEIQRLAIFDLRSMLKIIQIEDQLNE